VKFTKFSLRGQSFGSFLVEQLMAMIFRERMFCSTMIFWINSLTMSVIARFGQVDFRNTCFFFVGGKEVSVGSKNVGKNVTACYGQKVLQQAKAKMVRCYNKLEQKSGGDSGADF
jgi:hypothetical protein